MTIVKLQLLTKNNKERGLYLYQPIVEINGKYYWCESIKTHKVITKEQLSVNSLQVKREIPSQFYAANGLTN